MFLLQTKIPNMPSSDVSWEWKHGRVLQIIIYAKLVAPLSFMIRSYRTQNPSVVSRDISYQWNEYTLHKRDLTLFLERFDFSQSFLSFHVHFLHRPVCIHITSTDQAIKATQFAEIAVVYNKSGCHWRTQCYTSTHALVLSLGTYGEMLNVYFSETNKHHN